MEEERQGMSGGEARNGWRRGTEWMEERQGMGGGEARNEWRRGKEWLVGERSGSERGKQKKQKRKIFKTVKS